jgi:uncharacterized protein (TIGR03437 family)
LSAEQVSYAGSAMGANYPSSGAPSVLGLVSAGLGGLYQINATVPQGVPGGTASVVVIVAGQNSPQGVTMVIGASNSGPAPVPTGVVNAASFAKSSIGTGSAVAPGSLVQIYTSLAGAVAASTGAPFPATLGNVSVTFNGVAAPIQSVSPSGPYPSINAQVPFEVTGSTANMVVTVNNVSSGPFLIPIVAQAPGMFTIPAGVGNAVLVNLSDSSIAAPAGSIAGLTSHPIPRGQTAYFYATGLGAQTPAVTDGTANCLLSAGCKANATPTVLVGGVAVQIAFAGQAGVYAGVN